jgi:hypothetical protein
MIDIYMRLDILVHGRKLSRGFQTLTRVQSRKKENTKAISSVLNYKVQCEQYFGIYSHRSYRDGILDFLFLVQEYMMFYNAYLVIVPIMPLPAPNEYLRMI